MARIAGPHSLPQRQTDASCSIRCCLNRSPPRTSRSGGAARERLTSASKLRGEESCQQPSACGKSSQHLDQAYPLAVQDGRTLVVAVPVHNLPSLLLVPVHGDRVAEGHDDGRVTVPPLQPALQNPHVQEQTEKGAEQRRQEDRRCEEDLRKRRVKSLLECGPDRLHIAPTTRATRCNRRSR